jgi:phage terminase small subunit
MTPKQEAFVREYLIDLNATQAAIRAGSSEPNKQGPRLLVNVGIAAAIKAAMEGRAERTEITADWVLNGIRDLVKTCLEKEEFTVAMRGYELLGKHHGLFPNKVDVTVTDSIASDLEHARRRAAEAHTRH